MAGKNTAKKLARPHFSICKEPKVPEAWSGLLERIHRPQRVLQIPWKEKLGGGQAEREKTGLIAAGFFLLSKRESIIFSRTHGF